MTHGPVILSAGSPSSIHRAATELASGKLVVIPTDTVYGLAADPRVQGAEDRLRAAKGREPVKPIPILAADVESIGANGFTMTPAERRLASLWPGPLTLVLEKHGSTEGLRIPDHAVARGVLKACGGLLRVTSANRSGREPARTAAEAAAELGASVAMVLDDGPSPGGTPSSVVRVDDGRLVILREGAISREVLERTMEGKS